MHDSISAKKDMLRLKVDNRRSLEENAEKKQNVVTVAGGKTQTVVEAIKVLWIIAPLSKTPRRVKILSSNTFALSVNSQSVPRVKEHKKDFFMRLNDFLK